MNKYEIMYRDGLVVLTEGKVLIFNDECTGPIDKDIAFAANVKDILYIKKVNDE